jgi:hypothetical protein
MSVERNTHKTSAGRHHWADAGVDGTIIIKENPRKRGCKAVNWIQ